MSLPGPFLLMASAEPVVGVCERLECFPGCCGAGHAGVVTGSLPGVAQGLLGCPFPLLPSTAFCLSPPCAPLSAAQLFPVAHRDPLAAGGDMCVPGHGASCKMVLVYGGSPADGLLLVYSLVFLPLNNPLVHSGQVRSSPPANSSHCCPCARPNRQREDNLYQ